MTTLKLKHVCKYLSIAPLNKSPAVTHMALTTFRVWHQPRHVELILLKILGPIECPQELLSMKHTLASRGDLGFDDLHKVLAGISKGLPQI